MGRFIFHGNNDCLVFIVRGKEMGDLISEDKKLFESAAELIHSRAGHIELRKEMQ